MNKQEVALATYEGIIGMEFLLGGYVYMLYEASDMLSSEFLVYKNDGSDTLVPEPVSYTHLRAHETN